MENKEQEILQKHLARFLVTDVFNTVSEDDILKIKAPNVWEHKGKALSEGQIKMLREQAESFKDSALWQILRAEIKWHAYQNGYIKSKTEADQIAAKLLEYFVNEVDKKLQRMSVV